MSPASDDAVMSRSTSTDGKTIAAGRGVGWTEGVGVGLTDGVGVGLSEDVGLCDADGDALALATDVRDGDGEGDADRDGDGDGLLLPNGVPEGEGDGELSAYARVEAATHSSPRKSATASGLTGG